MESIPSMTDTSMTIEQAHSTPMRRFAMMFSPPTLRPPIFDEMQDDLERLIAKVARQYTDQSCPELNYDELVAEGRSKLAIVLCDKRLTFERIPTRSRFFALFKTSLNHHVRSLVHKFRFTEKRTGVKPPPKEERYSPVATEQRLKTAEVRLDDEEINLQVADQPCESAKNQEMTEIMDDYEALFDDLEVIVFRQLAAPNKAALFFATLDAQIGRHPGDPLNIKIKHEHLARGLGEKFTPELFNDLVLSIRQKITKHRSMTQVEEQAKISRNAALAQLEHIFNLQIPSSIDEIVVRRLLTICARDQYDKIEANPAIKDLLLEVGAKVPEMHGDVLNCRGVAYQKNNRICNSCGYRVACASEAHNYGLGKITISPRLLGAKLTRVPAILPNDPDAEEVIAPSDEEAELVAYLDENFRKMASKGQTYYAHKEKLDQSKRLFRVDMNGADFRIQVCGPGETLRKKLRYEQKCYFTPPGLSANEVIALIDQHAKETYAVA
jgi:hypothetical protein